MIDPRFEFNKVVLELWPSPEEVAFSNCQSPYRKELSEFYESYERLLNEINKSSLPLTPFVDQWTEEGQPVNRFEPPTVIELILSLFSAGGIAAAYKLLSLWLQEKNGRKLKVKFDEFEFESTQLNPDQFLSIIEKLTQIRKLYMLENSESSEVNRKERIRKAIESHNLKINESSEIDSFEEIRVFNESIEKLKNRGHES